jgi:alpha-glucosidase
MLNQSGIPITYSRSDNEIQFQWTDGQGKIRVINPWVINVFVPYAGESQSSVAIEKLPVTNCPVDIHGGPDHVEIETESLKIHVYNDFRITFLTKAGIPICADFEGKRRPLLRRNAALTAVTSSKQEPQKQSKAFVVKKMLGPEKFYGLGETTGPLNKRGYTYEMWNTDDPAPHVESHQSLYKSVPFLITLLDGMAFGLFFDNTFRARFDLGKENDEYYYYEADGGNLNYYFIAGPEMTDVVERYTSLTGRTPLPQLWTLGYHQCRWSYSSEERIREVATRFREHSIPCDGLYLDIDYMDGFRVFTWDKRRFPNPPRMAAELLTQGFKLVTIIDPGVKKDGKYEICQTGLQNDYFITDADGVPYVNQVWPGDSLFPDFSDSAVREWWSSNQEIMLGAGVAGIWNDMNEPASFKGPLPDDIRFKNDGRPTTHREIHNIYGHLMTRATYEGIKKLTGKRPFVITRACFAGTQKYATVWTGDNQSFWEHLRLAVPMLLNLGLSGFSFCGTDVGGFNSDCTGELLARWVQVGCFSPLFRNHSATGTRDQEPWAFNETILEINRKYIRLRYELIPYFYDLMRQTENSGLPVLRPLVLHYPHDERIYEIHDQFLCGPQILVAPILSQGQRFRAVYLPEGRWFDFWTQKIWDGNQIIIAEAGLDVCPIFIKAGSIIPRYPVQNFIGETEINELTLDIYPGEGQYFHYQDDGTSFAYREGQYNLYEFRLRQSRKPGELVLEIKKVHCNYSPGYRSFRIIAHQKAACSVEFNGNPVDCEAKNNRTELLIPAADGTIYFRSM